MASIFTRSGPFRLPVNEFVIEFYAETLFWESEVEQWTPAFWRENIT